MDNMAHIALAYAMDNMDLWQRPFLPADDPMHINQTISTPWAPLRWSRIHNAASSNKGLS
jgi:hypothetical protein